MADITAEYVRSRVSYDAMTGELTWRPIPERSRIDRMWNTRFAGKRINHKNSSGHIQFGLGGRNQLAHRIAWLIVHGDCPPLIDHKNGVRDDNRLCNLRAATRSQNASNSVLRKDNATGYRGVEWRPSVRRWFVRVGHQKRRYYAGSFGCITAAAMAYDRLASRLHGEFATLNFPTIGGRHS